MIPLQAVLLEMPMGSRMVRHEFCWNAVLHTRNFRKQPVSNLVDLMLACYLIHMVR